MTIARTGLSRQNRAFRPLRDRTDGGGGGTDTMDVDIEDGDDSTDDDDDSEDDDSEDDWKPPSKEEHDALTAALAKANKQARDRRLELKALREGKPAKDDSKDDTAKPDEARLRASIESETISTWKPLVVNAHATQALTAAGLIGKPGRLLNLLDLDEIDVDPADGTIDGLDDQIADLKKDYPHLFRRTRSRNIDASDKGERLDTKKMSASEIQAAQLRGEL